MIKLCESCKTPLLKEELPENRNPPMISFMAVPHTLECMACFFERADFDGMSDDPELQKEHKEFIKHERKARKEKFN